MKRMTDLSGWSSLLIAISTGIVANVLLLLFSRFDLQVLLFSTLNITLVMLLLNSLRSINQLIYLISSDKPTAALEDARQVLINDVLRSLRKYGYVRSYEQEERLKSILQDGKYIRSQNFYDLIEKGLISVREKFLYINDHPFKPFSELVLKNIFPQAAYVGINSIPDELYSREDIQRRIDLIQEKGIEYYLLPREDTHLSILIFDNQAALVYPTPFNRHACNFSEALFFTSLRSIEEISKIFFHIHKIARDFNSRNRIEVLQELEKILRF